MKLHSIYLFAAVLHLFFALPTEALIVLGGDEGHTSAPADDPGWDNVGYVRSKWNSNRASGVYLGDGWVLTSYHVLYYDAPTGIVFNADSDKTYPIDVSSYIRLETNSFTRMANSPYWENYDEVSADMGSEALVIWESIRNNLAPQGADLAMFRLSELPDITPVHISLIPAFWLSTYLNYINNDITAIATGRPRLEERTYWTTNWVETTSNSTEVAYSGYKDWIGDPSYQPICRWGKNKLYASSITVTRPPFGSTICLPTVFNDYGSGGTSDTFQMARLDSGGGVFYKGTGQWELLGMLTAKQLPNESDYTVDTTLHPFGSYSLICDLSRYREQIMRVTEWPDLSVKLLNTMGAWVEIGQECGFSIITSNNSTNDALTAFTNTLQLIQNTQTNRTVHFEIPALSAGESHTNSYSFTPDSPGTWSAAVTADSHNNIYEIIEGTIAGFGYKQNNLANATFYTGPDLRIVSLSPKITNSIAGAQITFTAGLTNGGNAAVAGSFTISLYTNTTDSFTTMSESELAEVLVTSITVTGLDAGASSTSLLTATAPVTIGTCYLKARIDSSNTVAEAIENNNWSPRSEIRIGPDLRITGSSPIITNAVAGSMASFNIIAENQGYADISGSFEISLYTNITDTFTAMSESELAEILATNLTVNGLSGYATITNILSTVTPATPGIYYVRARIDGSNTVHESVESNNWGPRSEIRVGPDLVIDESLPATINAAANAPVSIEVTVKNLGAGDVTNAFVLGVYAVDLQTGQGTSDPAWTNTIPSLPAKTSTTVTATFNAPTNTGTYYLISNADDYDSSTTNKGAVAEYREDNNSSILYGRQYYTVLNVGPDLIVAFTETNSVRAMAGTSISVSADVFNIGAGLVTGVQNILQISTNDTFEAAFSVSTNSGVGSFQFSFQAPRKPGTYYLRAQTDTLNQTAEFDESNNFSDIILLEIRPLAMPWLNLLLD